VTVAGDDLQAEVICGLLRNNGIPCMYRKTGMAAVIKAESGGVAMGGPSEILVDEADLEAAKQLLEP
jgi:hypothetical protein